MQPIPIQQAFELALRYHQAGQLVEAEQIYRKILAAHPKHFDAMHHMGIIAHEVGQHTTAIQLISDAIALHPDHAAAYSNLGEAYRALGRMDEALAAYRQAIALDPHIPDFHSNLAIVLAQRGNLAEAAGECRRALQIRPDWPEAHNNLGNIFRDQGLLEEAGNSYRTAIRLRPDFVEAYNNLANALRELDRPAEALQACRRALELQPAYPDALRSYGDALKDLGQLDEAIAVYRRALQIQPDASDICNNLGDALKTQGALKESLGAFQQALALAPHNPGIHSNLVYLMLFCPFVDGATLVAELHKWNERFGAGRKMAISRRSQDQGDARPLRIGYVSSDFCEHVIGRNLLPLFRHIDRDQFETICYSGVARADSLTEQIRSEAKVWRNTARLADDALARMIHEDAVDILVDLTQHMAGNRLPMFACQPAPVQASFAGYPEATGLETIRYRFSDRWLEQGGVRQADGTWVKSGGHEEVYLLDSFWCYDAGGVDVRINELPADDAGVITFGSLNNFCKVNETVLKLWARTLTATKGSRLMMLCHEGSNRQRTMEFLQGEGVEPQRVEFVTPRPRKEYLELYHRTDIVLDTFPYNGHTTSLDALWMGVPVVSLCGESPVSRAGLSQLSNLGLPELVAQSEDQYVEIATQLAGDLPRLKQLRSSLRQRMEQSVLMDAPHFARQIEACYRAMWRQRCESRET